jgi:hypothetical protein
MKVSRIFIAPKLLAAAALGMTLSLGATSASVSLTSTRLGTPSAFPSDGSFLGVSADSPSDAWAVGTYYNSHVGSLPLIGHWTGSTWKNVSARYPKNSDDDALYAVGALSPSDVWAVGTYEYPGDTDQPLAEHWNGSTWAIDNPLIPLNSVDVEILAISAVSASNIWVAGQFGGNDFTEYTVVEHWNGRRWSIAKTLNPSVKYDQNYMDGVSALSDGSVWAVGSWESAKEGYETLVERAAGRSWTKVPSPNSPNGYESSLASVDAHSSEDAWAVGSYALSTEEQLPLAEHWNGAEWSLVPIATPGDATNARMTSVSFVGKHQGLAVGYYQDGAPASGYFPMADEWDGTRWTETNPLIPSKSQSTNLAAVAFANNDSGWAVGDFTVTSTNPLIERWNGTSWTISAT